MIPTVSEINFDSFDSDIKFGDVKTLENTGGKVVPIYYKNKPFMLQTPQCYAPFGISVFKNDRSETCSLDLSFKNKDNRPTLDLFYKIIEKLDSLIINACMTSKQQWMKKKLTNKEVVEALYTSPIRYSKDKDTGEITDKYPPTFKMKVPYKDGKYFVKCFDPLGNLFDDIKTVDTKGSKVTCIIQCNGIWIAGDKFGCSFKLVQFEIIPRFSFSGQCMIQSSEEDRISDDKSTNDD
jgi:hypothetical protein